jgi:beta-phosphoglucomutase-like phosphatase (HAD superfamily)
MKVEPISGVIFDMDGTLLGTEEQSLNGMRKAMSELGYQIPDEVLRERVGYPYADNDVWLRTTLEIDESRAGELRALAKRYVREDQEKNGIHAREGAPELVEAVASRGLPIAIGTAEFREAALGKLVRAGYQPASFTAIVTGDEVKNNKPAPDSFNLCAERINVPPPRCGVVGDTFVDGLAADAARMRSFLVPALARLPRGINVSAACVICESMDDARRQLVELLDGAPLRS